MSRLSAALANGPATGGLRSVREGQRVQVTMTRTWSKHAKQGDVFAGTVDVTPRRMRWSSAVLFCIKTDKTERRDGVKQWLPASADYVEVRSLE